MLYKKQGMPDEDEIVLCTVTAVHHHSVFAKLDDYGKTGMIHISEVSPGRIRNLRDYVVEGKKIVCKVLRIDKQKGHIDLSLRRVNENIRRNKIDEIKQEQRAEKLIEGLAKKLNKDVKEIYPEISDKILKKYEYIHQCFNDVANNRVSLEKVGINEKTARELTEIIRERIKPTIVEIKGNLNLKSYDPNGIEIIKKTLKKLKNIGKESIAIQYLGAGKYGVKVKAKNYKEAEKILKKSVDSAARLMEKQKGIISFTRT